MGAQWARTLHKEVRTRDTLRKRNDVEIGRSRYSFFLHAVSISANVCSTAHLLAYKRNVILYIHTTGLTFKHLPYTSTCASVYICFVSFSLSFSHCSLICSLSFTSFCKTWARSRYAHTRESSKACLVSAESIDFCPWRIHFARFINASIPNKLGCTVYTEHMHQCQRSGVLYRKKSIDPNFIPTAK